ncbi:MAG: hypothetical protein NTW28_19575, partial [Candidatus Solibacter sp.]|nr:hypothetical protein [Candidatus Solibacter sp.]
ALIGVASGGGKDTLARVASLRGAPLIQDCLEVDLASGVVKKSHFSGRAMATIQLKRRPWILSIRPNCLPELPAERAATIVEYRAPIEDHERLVIREVKSGTAVGADLSEAEIIISGGENISSIEVERAIAAHPAVLECAVVSAPDPQWGEVPAAFVVVKPGLTLGQPALCEFLQQRIAKFKMPRRFQFSDTALPKTGTGKIIKRELRETFWSGKESRIQG